MSEEEGNDSGNVFWALAYAEAGFAVVSIWWIDEETGHCACSKGSACDRPGKHPLAMHGVKNATSDKHRVRALWGDAPLANVAVATGELSDCIVIDVDTADGKAGDIALTEATAPHGGVPPTLRARSASGGAHYFYRFRATKFTRKIGFLRNVDYLADGGYCIVQPSHRGAEKRYAWASTPCDTWAGVAGLRAEMRELPVWFDALQGSGRRPPSERRRRTNANAGINAAALVFRAEDPAWIEELRRAMTFIDPDRRDMWVLFGIILGRVFERGDAGWTLYEEWAARSAKFSDPGSAAAMREYYYTESQKDPPQGQPATVGTIFFHAQEGGWRFDARLGLDGAERVIIYRPGRAKEHVQDVLQRLAVERESDADTERVYAFGSGLGCVVERHDFGAAYVAGRPPGGWVLQVSPYSAMLLGNRITHTATIAKASARGSVTPVECPPEMTHEILEKHTKAFPKLNGIVQWPMVAAGTGRVTGFDDEDYDAASGLLFRVADWMEEGIGSVCADRDSALAAIGHLRERVLEDFPFGSERDGVAAVALLMTFLQRRAMSAAPAFLITAPIPGSGKTTLARFASRLVHGRSLGAASLSSVPEEQRKAVTSALLTNPPALLWDNLAEGSVFNSVDLAVAMTSGEWEDRKLGESLRLQLPNRAVWCFTGNNVGLKSDLRRRFVTVRMVPRAVGFHERRFSRDIDVWPTEAENRVQALRALLSVGVWAARNGGAPPGRGSGFPEWDAAVRWPLMALTGVDPLLSFTEQADAEAGDGQESALAAVVLGWCAVFGAREGTVRAFRDAAEQAAKSSDSARRAAADAAIDAVSFLREKRRDQITNREWGDLFRTLQDRPIRVEGVDCAIERSGEDRHSKTALWHLRGAKDLLAAVVYGGGSAF